MVDFIAIEKIDNYAQNSRVHPEAQLGLIRQLMVGDDSGPGTGWTVPALIEPRGDRYEMIAGHGRLEIARRIYKDGGQLKMADGTDIPAGTIPVVFARGWSDEQKRAYVIADNQLPQMSEWDNDILSAEITALNEGGFNLDLLGFTDADLEGLLPDDVVSEVGLTDPDDAPKPNQTPVSQPGMVWLCGNHRVMCGDSTQTADLETLTDGHLVDMWLTDPPYNVAIDRGARHKGKKGNGQTIKNDDMPDDAFHDFLVKAYRSAADVMKPGAVFYIWHSDMESYQFRRALADVGWPLRQCLIWKKQAFVVSRQDYHWLHESCLYGWKPGAGHLWASDRKQTTILEFDRPTKNAEHPTMKPVALFEYLMLNNTKGGDLVLDSFGGSGTTLVAAEKNGRRAALMELDPLYCDVIIRRWQEFTGKQATLESSGVAFDAMKAKHHG